MATPTKLTRTSTILGMILRAWLTPLMRLNLLRFLTLLRETHAPLGLRTARLNAAIRRRFLASRCYGFLTAGLLELSARRFCGRRWGLARRPRFQGPRQQDRLSN